MLTHVEDIEIESVFGHQLLSYLLGTDDVTLPAESSEGQRAVIEFLQQLIPQLQGQDAPYRIARLQEVLLAYQEEQDTTLFNGFLSRATGKPHERNRHDDPVAEELLRLASDSYAGY